MGIIRREHYRRPRFRPTRAGLAHADHRGFTIVELLIVIVVIGILAAITIVAYTGVTQKANQAAAQSAAESAAKKVLAYMSLNSDQVPGDLATAGVPIAGLQYSSNTSSSPQTFCITATSGNQSMYVDNSTHTTPSSGACFGHSNGGVAAIVNLAPNPSSELAPLGGNVYGGTGTVGPSTVRKYVGTSSTLLTMGSSYAYVTLSPDITVTPGDEIHTTAWVYSSASSVLVARRGAGVPFSAPGYSVTPNSWQRVVDVYTIPSGATSFHPDLGWESGSAPAGSTVYVDAVMITKGPTTYNYSDGTSPGWSWSGTANSSTSAGPPL